MRALHLTSRGELRHTQTMKFAWRIAGTSDGVCASFELGCGRTSAEDRMPERAELHVALARQ